MKLITRVIGLAVFFLPAICLLISPSRGQTAKRTHPHQTVAKRTTLAPLRTTVAPPEMSAVEPGTSAAKRLATLRAKVKAGRIPTVQLGGFRGNQEVPTSPVPEDHGSRLIPSPKAKGKTLAFQEDFVKAFRKLDPQPASRVAHYSWLPKIDHVRQLGWCGAVRESQAQPDGSTIVKIRVYPALYSPFMRTAVLDYVDETYAVADGQLHLLDTDAVIPKPDLQVFPLPG